MGLRIGSNVGVLNALRNLTLNRASQSQALERLATGLRINRAADDPSGLVLSEQLRAQLASTAQAIENTQFDANLVSTADAALGQASDILVRNQALAVAAANSGVLGPEAQQALQSQLDQSLQALNRIGATTRFAGQDLLNGNASIQTDQLPAGLLAANITQVSPDNFPQGVNIDVSAFATAANAGTIDAVQASDSTVVLRGNNGTVSLNFTAGQTSAEVAAAINATTDQTGVQVVGGQIQSVDVGSNAVVEVQVQSGTFGGITPGVDNGTDIQATVNGQTAGGNGNTVSVAAGDLVGQFTFDTGVAPGTFSFNVTGGGLRFQIGTDPTSADALRIGLPNVNTSTLGTTSANLASLATGGANSLANNPLGALNALRGAQDQILSSRGALGSIQSQVLETNVDALGVAFENISASESSLRDANFALELSNSTRAGILAQASQSTLGQLLVNQGSILRLLGV